VPAGGTACSGTVDAVPAGSPYAIGEDAPPAGWRTVGCLPGSVTVIPGQTATVYLYQRRRRKHPGARKSYKEAPLPAEGSLPPSAFSGPNSFTATVSCTVPAGGTACSGTVDAVPAGNPYAIGEDAPPAGWRTVGCLPGSVTVIPGQTATITCTNEGVGSIQCGKSYKGAPLQRRARFHLPHQWSNSFTATVSCAVPAGGTHAAVG